MQRNKGSFDFFFIPLVINSMNVATINIRLVEGGDILQRIQSS